MTFIEKYPKLQDEAFLIQKMVESVYATMLLENQGLPKWAIEMIVLSVFKSIELKRSQTFLH